MSGIQAVFNTPEVACVAATAKTVGQIIAATNTRVKVLSWALTLDGISPTSEPVNVKWVRQTNAIGGTPTSVTGSKVLDLGSETLQTTFAYSAGGTEPTQDGTKQLDARTIHPQGGYAEIFAMSQEWWVTGGTRLGCVVTAPANVNATLKVTIEE